MINISEYTKFAIDIAKKAGSLQMLYFGNITEIKKKSNHIDILTEADTKSEELIINEIKLKYPNHSIISEESPDIHNDSEYKWIIDPLDGTTNFTHNLPIFAVSIALLKNNNIISGVVYNAAADKCFHAEINKGSYLNNEKINVSSSSTLSDSLLATGFPYLHDSRYDLSFTLFKVFYDQTRGIRRLGAAALDLCFVAMGRFDGFYEFELNSWDIVAGTLIVKEAGGIVTDWDGNEVPLNGKRILASNKKIHKEMTTILTKDKYKIFY